VNRVRLTLSELASLAAILEIPEASMAQVTGALDSSPTTLRAGVGSLVARDLIRLDLGREPKVIFRESLLAFAQDIRGSFDSVLIEFQTQAGMCPVLFVCGALRWIVMPTGFDGIDVRPVDSSGVLQTQVTQLLQNFSRDLSASQFVVRAIIDGTESTVAVEVSVNGIRNRETGADVAGGQALW
jgi:hypothetical protein